MTFVFQFYFCSFVFFGCFAVTFWFVEKEYFAQNRWTELWKMFCFNSGTVEPHYDDTGYSDNWHIVMIPKAVLIWLIVFKYRNVLCPVTVVVVRRLCVLICLNDILSTGLLFLVLQFLAYFSRELLWDTWIMNHLLKLKDKTNGGGDLCCFLHTCSLKCFNVIWSHWIFVVIIRFISFSVGGGGGVGAACVVV